MAAPVLPPPLRDGDRMSREEFLRRWEAMPDLRWAELIDGVVYMPSPVSDPHMDFHARLNSWLGFYATATPGCRPRPAGTWLMSDDSAPQPNLALKVLPEYGGQPAVEGGYAAGAPELIVEVSHTTTARDSGIKLRLYERSGVLEYIIVRPAKKQIAWRVLVDGKYQVAEPDPDATVQLGIVSAEHQEFARALADRRSGS